VVTHIPVVVLQLEKRRGRLAARRNREEGEKRAWRRPSPEAGEGGGAPANFDEDMRFPKLGGDQMDATCAEAERGKWGETGAYSSIATWAWSTRWQAQAR
jgi:hypothetical protein